MSRHRAVCDCSRPATRQLGSAWVCDYCYAIDSGRLQRERERRERERRARNRVEEFAETPEAFHSFAI
jgi:hypothetical protein